jgi:hypothetical protein
VELSKLQQEDLVLLTQCYLDAIAVAREKGLTYPGSENLNSPWTDVYTQWPTRPGPVDGMAGSIIQARVSDLGVLTSIILPSRSFIRLQLLGAGMKAGEVALWDLLTHQTLTNVGVSPVRRDYICNCELADVYGSLDSLLGQECDLSYSCFHFELEGLAHVRSSQTLLFYLSSLLIASKFAACVALEAWRPAWPNDYVAKPGALEWLLRTARTIGRVELEPVIFPCEAV